ncbi:MAG: ribbon-helix-helix protein, CopG family [Myxococcales bacterium]|nr:ribbon-helix-helix protein, CopG family [Myxococcales bacterium]
MVYGNHMSATALKTTVYLDPADYDRLKRIATDGGATPAALIREAVAEYVRRHGRKRKPRSLGAGHSGRADLSERADDLLRGMGRTR